MSFTNMDLKLVKIASVREHMDAHYRGEISYSKAVDLINKEANEQLRKHAVSGRSEQLCFCGQKLEIKVGDNRAWRECNNGHEQ